MKASLTRHGATLLGLRPEPFGNSAAQRTQWENKSAITKSTIILALSEVVQIRAIALVDDDTKTAHELWEFLATTYTASNEQAIQNIRVKLDSLIFKENSS